VISDLRSNNDQNWEAAAASPFPAFRKASANIEFYLPRNGQFEKSMTDEWLRFTNGEKFTMESLGYVADMFPQVVESYGEKRVTGASKYNGSAKFWYPTLLLNLEIKKDLPPDGVEWLFVRVQAKEIKNGRMDLEVVILDEEGDLVALSHHVAMILSAARNTAKRGEEKPSEDNSKL